MARKIHDLKTDPEMWSAVACDLKKAEFRRDDRGFKVGDILRLRNNEPPHSIINCLVTHIVRGPAYGIPEGYAMLSIRSVTIGDPEDALHNRIGPIVWGDANA